MITPSPDNLICVESQQAAGRTSTVLNRDNT